MSPPRECFEGIEDGVRRRRPSDREGRTRQFEAAVAESGFEIFGLILVPRTLSVTSIFAETAPIR